MLVHRELRRDSICKGGEKQQRLCPLASSVKCVECGTKWECADTGPADKRLSLYSGDCGSCGSSAVSLERCDSCPVIALEHARAKAPAGRLLDRILELRFDLKHFRLDWGEVTCEERDGLKILESETADFERESAKRAAEQQKMDQMMQTARQRR